MASINKLQTIAEQAKKDALGITTEDAGSVVKNTINIDGKVYKIKPLIWEEGIELWEDIAKRCLPSIGSGFDRFQHDELDGSPTTFTEAAINLSRNLDGFRLKTYSQALFDGATVDGEPLDLNKEFTANYGAWRKLFAFAMKENFQSFFDQGWITGMLEKMTSFLGQTEPE